MMREAFICDATRTPIGRYAGVLSGFRPDDLAAHVLAALVARNPRVDWGTLDDVILGCANQAGEDNRNVARMASLLAGLPVETSGTTINRLCGSGLDAVTIAARTIMAGDADLIVAGGVESMSRAPFVLPKSDVAFGRSMEIHDTTIGWRFVNPLMASAWGSDSMPQTAENVADDFAISRLDQDRFACASQQKAASAQQKGRFAVEISPLTGHTKKGEPYTIDRDEHLRPGTTMEQLATLKGIVKPGGSVTAGNSSGVNDGACALLLASAEAIRRFQLNPMARVMGGSAAGVPPRIMGVGPVPATRKLLARLKISLDQIQVIELNEAFAAQGLAVIRELGLDDDDPRINGNGGAIALGHPLGMSGARLATTAAFQLHAAGGSMALCTMCIGVGQGISLLLERA